MAYDCELAEQGHTRRPSPCSTTSSWAGRSSTSLRTTPPTRSSRSTRPGKLVESDGINVMIGPIFSPSAKAVADYLGKSSAAYRRCLSWGSRRRTWRRPTAWPSSTPASSTPMGTTSASSWRSRATRRPTSSTTTTRPPTRCTAGFKKAFVDEGGGEVLSENYVPLDTVDFSAYLTTMKPADVTLFWIFGNGAVPFVQQYNDYGLTAPLGRADVQQLQRRPVGGFGRPRVWACWPATTTPTPSITP